MWLVYYQNHNVKVKFKSIQHDTNIKYLQLIHVSLGLNKTELIYTGQIQIINTNNCNS